MQHQSKENEFEDIKAYHTTNLKESNYIISKRHLSSSQESLKQIRLLSEKRCINGTDLLMCSFSFGTNLMLTMGFYLYILLKWLLKTALMNLLT